MSSFDVIIIGAGAAGHRAYAQLIAETVEQGYARLVDSRNLNPGEYAIEVRVRDRVSGQNLVQSAKFTIVQ